jgi:hypothetical protein
MPPPPGQLALPGVFPPPFSHGVVVVPIFADPTPEPSTIAVARPSIKANSKPNNLSFLIVSPLTYLEFPLRSPGCVLRGVAEFCVQWNSPRASASESDGIQVDGSPPFRTP